MGTRSKFNQYQVNSTCPLCLIEDEDVAHMLLRCSELHSVRKEPYRILKDYIVSRTCSEFWRTVFPTKDSLIKLIIDCGQIEELQSAKQLDLLVIERLSRKLCFAVHTERLKKLNEG